MAVARGVAYDEAGDRVTVVGDFTHSLFADPVG
jgi:hypothetical protein